MNKIKYLLMFALLLQICFAFSQSVSVRFRDVSTPALPLTQAALNVECQAQFGQNYTFTFPTVANRWRFQWYKDGGDNVISPLSEYGLPTGDDIEAIGLFNPGNTTGTVFLTPVQTWVPSSAIFTYAGGAGNTFIGDKVYIRIFNASTIAAATKYMSFTSLYTITTIGTQTIQPFVPAYAWSPWSMVPPNPIVDITSTPDNADIFADGIDTGFNTPHIFMLSPHSNTTFTVAKPGYTWTPSSFVINDIMTNVSQNFVGSQTIIPGESMQVTPPGNVLIASVTLETPGTTSFDIDYTVLNINALTHIPPNGGLNNDNSYAIMLSAASGTVDMSISVPAGTWWICGYWDGTWHQAIPYPYSNTVPGTVTLYGIPFGLKGEVPLVISEGEGLDPTLPVTLSSFTATIASQSYVNLTWVTESETQVLGYNVYRAEDNSMGNSIKLNQVIIPATNTSERQSYTLSDSDGLQANQTYYYWLENVDMGGGNNLYGPVSATITEQFTPELPGVTTIINAYPNPIRTGNTAKIDVNLKAGETGTVNIYNVRGQLVKKYNVHQGVNELSWDAKGCGSGIYFCRLSTPTANVIRKLVITN